jgi:hypothetical protein
MFPNLLQDVRFAIRQLRKNAGFTCTAVLMLAIGICASVAIFAFVDAALIKLLPYQNPSRLVGVFGSVPQCPQCNLAYPDYLDWERPNQVFRSVDAYAHTDFTLSTPADAQAASGARVSDGFFRTLGITPVLGRDFYSGEDLPAAPRTVLLSYSAWQKRYGGEQDVVGQTVTLDGDPNNTIIGLVCSVAAATLMRGLLGCADVGRGRVRAGHFSAHRQLHSRAPRSVGRSSKGSTCRIVHWCVL